VINKTDPRTRRARVDPLHYFPCENWKAIRYSNNVCLSRCLDGKAFSDESTIKSARKETIDGVEYFVLVGATLTM